MNGALTLPGALTNIRDDLSDTDDSQQRWSDDQLTRALNRALDRYSRVSPLLSVQQIPTVAGARLYPVPAPPPGSTWWIERVEYPSGLWPRQFRTFDERPDAQFEIQLDDGLLPADDGQTIELTLAARHLLDAAGTSVPEWDWDCVFTGAEAHALEAYLVSVNDNFDFVDGQFRDRVDDSKAPPNWRAQAADLMSRFEARLAEIKLRAETRIVATTQWGDKPYRWDRL
ncbi:MAG: hypothetical protein ACRDFS_07200 [Chloroflexota bacterium]